MFKSGRINMAPSSNQMRRHQQSKIARQRTTGWLAYLDVYGFSAEVRENSLVSVVKRLRRLQSDVAKTISAKRAAKYVFSDSVVIFWPATASERQKIATDAIDVLRTLQKLARLYDFLLRGVVTYGIMSTGPDYFVGEPLLRAVRLEQLLSIPLVVVPDVDLNPDENALPLPYQIANVPTKIGLTRAYPILPAPRRDLSSWVEQKAFKHLREGPHEVAQAWHGLHEFLQKLPPPIIKPPRPAVP